MLLSVICHAAHPFVKAHFPTAQQITSKHSHEPMCECPYRQIESEYLLREASNQMKDLPHVLVSVRLNTTLVGMMSPSSCETADIIN